MAKGILKFDLDEPYEEKRFKRAVKAEDAYLVLWDLAQEVFRPARKHGYSNQKIQRLLDKSIKGTELIGELESMFYRLIEEYGIELD